LDGLNKDALIKTAFKFQKKWGDNLDRILNIIVGRLKEGGIDPVKIPSCIETVFNITFLYPVVSYHELNTKMQSLGWQNFQIDEHTFKLIKLFYSDTETAAALQ
jgi:hypothetical protein